MAAREVASSEHYTQWSGTVGVGKIRDGHGVAVSTAIARLRDALRRLDDVGRDDAGPFALVSDNDGHWYVVPVARLSEWNTWCEIPSDDERAWDAPDYARRVGGAPSLVSFTDPVIE